MPNDPFDPWWSALPARWIADMQARGDITSHALVRRALETGDITRDQYDQFLTWPDAQRTQFVTGLIGNLVNRWKQNSPGAPTPKPTPNVIIPDTGAAAYWYVDPRADPAYDPTAPAYDPTIAALERWKASLKTSSGSDNAFQVLQ